MKAYVRGMADDLDWIVSTARQHDQSLDHDIAVVLAQEALQILRGPQAPESSDAPAVARALLAAHPEYGASTANVIAKAAVDFLAAPIQD